MRKFSLLLMLVFVSLFSIGQEYDTKDDKTESPYFLVKTISSEKGEMPLKATNVDVHIAGIIADVSVKQIYVNEGEDILEAVYIFPGSTNAAVYSMTMYIGDRKLKAAIREKEKARMEYEIAKNEGKTVSLLEQHRPNVFQMNVGNILPGDSIVIEMNYTELIQSENGVYEFVFPTVVGPRYTQNNEEWINAAKEQNLKKPDADFNINISINAGMPIQFVKSPSHIINVEYPTIDNALISLHPKDKTALDIISPETISENYWIGRDYSIQYGLRGEQPKSGLLTYEQGEENFFLLMIQPPKKIESQDIPKREYIFIVDVSGSMGGFPISVSKNLLRNLLSDLNPDDKFNVMLFAAGNSMLSEESLYATQKNIDKAIHLIDNQNGGGGTEIYPAVKRALELDPGFGYSRVFIPITDGYVAVENELFQLVRDNLDEANMFAFGIGSSVNRFLIEGLANAGMGEPFIVTNESEASEEGKKFLELVRNPVLTDISIDFDDFEIYDLNTEVVPDLFSQRPIIIYGKYKGKPKGTITVKGTRGNSLYSEKISIKDYAKDETASLRYLWARNRIKYWDDFAQYYEDISKQKEEITKLGLTYNLLTKYTSFIAVDDQVRVQKDYPKKENGIPNNEQNDTPNNTGNNSVNLGYTPGLYNNISGSTEMEEVIVTGLGISTDVKALGYSITEVNSDEIALNSLSGKVAGLNITNTSGSPGASTGIVIRGESSFSGNGQPLILIDGVPVNNTTGTSNNGSDFGNGENDINPDDIENISILKGNAATSLYGSKAANGIILIKTKKGEDEKFGLKFSSFVSTDIVDQLPDLQNVYSQGRPINETLNWQGADSRESFSWGPKIQNLEYDSSGNLVQPGSGNGKAAKAYNPYAFFTNGMTANTSVSMNGNVKKKYSWYFSISNLSQKGFIPKSRYNKTFLNLKTNYAFTPKFSTVLSAKYTNSIARNFPKNRSYSNIMYDLLTTSPSFDNGNGLIGKDAVMDLNTYTLPDGSQRSYNGGITDNPYFSINRNSLLDKGNHFVVSVNPSFKINDTWEIKASTSYSTDRDENDFGFGLNSSYNQKGEYSEYMENFESFLSDLSVKFDQRFNSSAINITADAGYLSENTNCSQRLGTGLQSGGLLNIENMSEIIEKNSNFNKKQTFALMNTMLSLFDDRVHLSLSGRGDQNPWNVDKNILFATSGSISLVISQFYYGLRDIIPFAKIYASFGKRDNEIPLYFEPTFLTSTMFDINKPLYGKKYIELDGLFKIENKSEFETGFDLRLFNNKIRLDAVYYNSTISNKYIPAVIEDDHVVLANAGKVSGKGIEISADFEILRLNQITLTSMLTFTNEHHIVSGIKDMYPEGVTLIGLNGFSSKMYEGQEYGIFYGTRYLRNVDGEKIIGSDGFPIVDNLQGIIGDPNPDFTMGLQTKLTLYKFELSAQFDYKKGGDVWNGTKNTLNYFGVSKETGDLRETIGYVFEGVNEDGEVNTIPVSFADPSTNVTDNRWTRYGINGVAEDAIEDGTWLRLNNLSLSYRIPRYLIKKMKLDDIKLSLFAKNLFTITSYSGITPDTEIVRAAQAKGIDYFNLPSVKSYGFVLSIEL